jgi:hypothetical protein
MIHTLLQIIDSTSTVKKINQVGANSTNYWFWIAIAEFVLILILLLLKIKKQQPSTLEGKILDEAKDADIDFKNLFDSINNSEALYSLLKKKCHPDRFLNPDQNKIADALFQEITKNKRNYNKLLELKVEAEKQLNITF